MDLEALEQVNDVHRRFHSTVSSNFPYLDIVKLNNFE